jgi:hypothetical protein
MYDVVSWRPTTKSHGRSPSLESSSSIHTELGFRPDAQSCRQWRMRARDLKLRTDANRLRPFVADRARTCRRLQEFARRSGTGVHNRHRPAIGRESRPRFSGVGCDVRSLPAACHAGARSTAGTRMTPAIEANARVRREPSLPRRPGRGTARCSVRVVRPPTLERLPFRGWRRRVARLGRRANEELECLMDFPQGHALRIGTVRVILVRVHQMFVVVREAADGENGKLRVSDGLER